jgi:exonuclease SbcC
MGLDLLIEDHWQGTERLPATLSGGEGFLASLALALALSESVQSEAGGIRLDSIFIDEGFGTLDGDLLNLVLKTLTELQVGGRMVGVISHVDTLKSVIPAQIELKPQPQGSEIYVKPF